MRNVWVRVIASSPELARDYFCNNFALPIMGDKAKFAFQYKEGELNKSYFPEGEYMVMTAYDSTEDEEIEEKEDCPHCGAADGQECNISCPNNNSSFTELIRDGYD